MCLKLELFKTLAQFLTIVFTASAQTTWRDGREEKRRNKMGLNIEGEEGRRERSSIKCNWIVPEQSLQRKRALKCRKSV